MIDLYTVICSFILSAVGIGLSYFNSRIAACPRNTRNNQILEIGFILTFAVSFSVWLFGLDIAIIRYALLIFLFFAVVYVANKTFDHYFEHEVRKEHFCQHKAYTNNLEKILSERTSGST